MHLVKPVVLQYSSPCQALKFQLSQVKDLPAIIATVANVPSYIIGSTLSTVVDFAFLTFVQVALGIAEVVMNDALVSA